MKTSSISVLILTVVLTISVPILVRSQTDTELVNAPACSADQISDWSWVRAKTLGVTGRDVFGHEVGSSGARKRILFDLGGNWMPISGRKETLCGTLNRFGFYPGIWDLDREEDWNNFIIPDHDFKFLIKDVQQLFPKSVESTPRCGDMNEECIEVEVTVHDDFFENRYFKRNKHKFWPTQKPASILTNQKLCTYGTWIREKVHEDHAELHPSELFWWTAPEPSGPAPFREWWLLAVLDSSNRFNSPTDFDPDLVETRPWANSPKTNQFKLALQVKTGEPITNLRIKQHENHGVTPSLEDTGTTHLLKHNGLPLVSVTEEQATENIGVRFDFCRDDAANRWIGYLDLTSTLEADGDGYGGYQVIQVIRDDGLPRAAATPTPVAQAGAETTARYEMVPGSLKRIEVDGQPRLVADIQLEMAAATSAELKDDVLKKLNLLTTGKKERIKIDNASELTAAANSQPGSRYLLRDVPFGLGTPQKNARVEIETPQGKQTLEIRDLALVPEVRRETILVQSPDESALATLLGASGLGPATQPESSLRIDAAKTQTVTVDVGPTYAPLRQDGKPAREDESAVVTALNESVRKAVQGNDFRDYETFFKTKVPFKMTAWQFKAVNLATGQEVPVREVTEGTEAADSNEVRIIRASGSVAHGNIKVLFPRQTPGVVYDLVMTATMEDANKYTGSFEHHVWSHYLSVPKTNIEVLLRLIAGRAGLSYDQLSQQWQGAASRLFTDEQTRRARIFRTLALQAVEDEKVTFEELERLARATKLNRPR